MRRRSVSPALLLAAWLLPLAAQVGVILHLLDGGRRAHPPSMVELLVHGHPHGGRVPGHKHTVREGPAAEKVSAPPAASGDLSARREGVDRVGANPPAGPTVAVGRALASAPLRHLLLGVLLR